MPYHPIVLGDQVIVTDGTRVIAYNLSDRPAEGDGSLIRGVEPAWKYDPESHVPGPTAQRLHTGVPRYTLTAVGHRIYARLGATSPAFFLGMNGVGAGVSSIVALDWDTQGKLLWEQQATKLALPDRPPDRNNFRTLSFEGTPVADSENVYVAVTDRREQTALYVACFDADTGASRWVRYLGTAPPQGQNVWNGGMPMPIGMTAPGDFNHRLLTLDGATLYYQTNLGALVALEAETGSLLWVATYPRHDDNQGDVTSDRDLNPAVVHGGRVFVAPSDADSIFAFDAASGRKLWKGPFKANDVKLTHLLGVARGRLVATGNCVLLLDVKTGKLDHTWPDSGKLEGFGRGLLAGDFIYWPTQNEIQVLDQRSSLRTEAPIKLLENYHTRGGNLAVGDGYLIVAQADGLVVFCQNSRLIERYQDEIAKTPDYAPNYFRLARAAEAIGKDQLALAMYAEASQRARPQEMIDGLPLDASARDHRFGLLIRLANQGRRAKNHDQAIDQLEEAAKVARSDPDRLQAQMLLADVLLDARRPGDAVAICERLLNDERLRPLAVAATDGRRTLRADLLIADRLKTIVRDNGRAVYTPYDRQAKALFERGKAEQDARVLDELCRTYPVATVVPLALLELGAIHESKGKFSDAAHAYKRMLAVAASDEARALALWRLAHVYEERRLFVVARDSYLDLQARFPGVRLPGKDGELTAGERVAAELARASYASLVADRPRPPTGVPMVRRWHLQVPAGQGGRVLSAQGVAPSLDVGKLVVVDKTGLRILDPSTGVARWLTEVGEAAVWAGFLADKLIVASPRQIVALELSQGAVQWRDDPVKPSKNGGQPDPFAAAKPADSAGSADRGGESLSGFQLVKGRLFCQRGRHELLALDGDTGALDWSFSSPIGEINPHIWIGLDRAVFQVLKPNELLVLQTDDGKQVTRVAQGEKEVLERPPFPIDEDSVLLVSDRRTVKKVELVHGQTNWVYRESEDLPVNGPPRLLGDAERLLVLHDGRTLIRLDAATGSKRWACLLAPDALDSAGESFLDRKTHTVSYWPMGGENLAAEQVIAPALVQLIRLEGQPEQGRFVHDVTFRGLQFAHADWTMDAKGYADTQAGMPAPAAIEAIGAVDCKFERCTMAHSGGYALHLGQGSKRNQVLACELFDLGGGGVKIGEPNMAPEERLQNFENIVADNNIHDLGLVFAPAVGVWVLQSSRNEIVHNHIHDLFYTAISVGWTWGYGANQSKGNIVEYNHLHNIGKEMLSDMGAIYTLGVQPGTRIRNNLIHDVASFSYGGWGIYPDEGSSEMLIENNIVYNCKSAGLHQHYGRENVIRNNIWAFNREFQLMRSRAEDHLSFTFEHNIVYFNQGLLLGGNWTGQMFAMSHNLYFDTRAGDIRFAGQSLAQWQEAGHDTGSTIGDPFFVNAGNYDFRLSPNSPALKMGFHQIDMSTVGPRVSAGQ